MQAAVAAAAAVVVVVLVISRTAIAFRSDSESKCHFKIDRRFRKAKSA